MGKCREKREPPPTPFAVVEAVLRRYLPNLDVEVCEAMLAAVVASQLDGPPVWLELVAPPSAGKTVLIEPLEEIHGGTIISKLTPSTLLSGAYALGGGDPSLLTRLGDRPFLLIKELSSLLEGNPYGRGDIYAQLREVYDGSYAREYGNGVRRSWKGKAAVIIGITPAIDRHRAFDSQLGERCLKIRFNALPGRALEDLAYDTISNIGQEGKVRQALHTAYEQAITEATACVERVRLSDDTRRRVACLATFAATVRTHVERNQYASGNPVILPPAPELPHRIVKNLHLVAIALTALRGDTELYDVKLIERIAFDCMPEPRRSILKRLITYGREGTKLTVNDFTDIVSESAVRMALEDLRLLSLVLKEDGDGPSSCLGGKPPSTYILSPTAERWLRQGGVSAQKSKGEGVKKKTEVPLESGEETPGDNRTDSRSAT